MGRGGDEGREDARGLRRRQCDDDGVRLDVAIEQVSIKATTTERLGFTGRGEGMAAQAIATVRMPAR